MHQCMKAVGYISNSDYLAALAAFEKLLFDSIFFGFKSSERSLTIGVATKMDEYVPTMIPMIKAKAKPLILPPPNKNNGVIMINVVIDVMIVLENVLLIAIFNMLSVSFLG